jgi:hypothetical protein
MTLAQLLALLFFVGFTGLVVWLLLRALDAGAQAVALMMTGILAMFAFADVLWFGAVFKLGIKPGDLIDILKHGSERGG